MKTLILILFIVVGSLVNGQEKDVNTIVVDSTSFNEAVTRLLDDGYKIDKIDKDFKTVLTEPKNYSTKVGGMVRIYLREKSGSIIIKGNCGLRKVDFEKEESDFLGQKFYWDIKNRGAKGLLKESFDEMKRFALSFNRPVTYLKE